MNRGRQAPPATASSHTVGVTGHRPKRLEGIDPAAMRASVRSVLATIATAMGHERGLRLVSSLAEGADSIAADEALALGWTLDVVLPFSHEDNRHDYPDPGARTALDARLARANAVFALNGARVDADEAAQAYERAGRIMLAQSDILIAIWDGAPPRGRGGTAQIVAEAVAEGIPVIHIAITPDTPPLLLWDGLDEHDLGQQSLETVPRGGLDQLPRLAGHLADPAAAPARFASGRPKRLSFAIAYQLLLSLTGVRRLRRSDFLRRQPADAERELLATCRGARGEGAFAKRLRDHLAPAYARADAVATEAARRFRSAWVANFSLAALAVIVSLFGLVLPAAMKPFLIALELAIVASILLITHLGRRSGWHQRWLDCRQTAERLRCLAISAQLGELALRGIAHPVSRAVARSLALPDSSVDDAYLTRVRDDLLRLIEDQVAYLDADAGRMDRLEHRLHRAGELLFGATATICVAFLGLEIALAAMPALRHEAHAALIWGTIGSAALPAVGAAIYGIRMQGDFAGIAERNEALAEQLRRLRLVSVNEPLSFDALLRRVRRVSELLIDDLSSWLHTYHARPLALPG